MPDPSVASANPAVAVPVPRPVPAGLILVLVLALLTPLAPRLSSADLAGGASLATDVTDLVTDVTDLVLDVTDLMPVVTDLDSAGLVAEVPGFAELTGTTGVRAFLLSVLLPCPPSSSRSRRIR